MSYVVFLKTPEGVMWFDRAVATEGGAKRSVTCLKKGQKALGRGSRAGTYAYMDLEDWDSRTVPMKKVRNLLSGKEIEIPADTPLCCDPSSETYWSM